MNYDIAKINYKESGSGPKTILFLHGWGCDRNTFDPIAKGLSENNRMISIDFPGFGESPEPDEAWQVSDYVDVTFAFIKRLSLKQEELIVIAHSFGVRVLIKMLNQGFNPRAVIFTGGAGIKVKVGLVSKIKVGVFGLLSAMVKLILPKASATKLINYGKGSFGSADYKNSSVVMRETLVNSIQEDLTPLLQNIKKPTLLIWGAKDTATPLAHGKIMEKEIKDAGLVVFPASGHFPFLENPKQFYNTVKYFVDVN